MTMDKMTPSPPSEQAGSPANPDPVRVATGSMPSLLPLLLYFPGREPHRQHNRPPYRLPGMDDVGTKGQIVARLLQGDALHPTARRQSYLQCPFDKNGNGCRMPCCPGTRALLTIRMDTPFQLNLGLMAEALFSRNKLADEPACASHLIDRGVSLVKGAFQISFAV